MLSGKKSQQHNSADTLPHNPARAEQGEKSTKVRQKRGFSLGKLGQERCSVACQRHRCQIEGFCWFSYNKRFPLPSVSLGNAVCTLSNSYKELYEQPHTSFHAIKNPANVTCGLWALATNGPGFSPQKIKITESLCPGGWGPLTWLVAELQSPVNKIVTLPLHTQQLQENTP